MHARLASDLERGCGRLIDRSLRPENNDTAFYIRTTVLVIDH
jgi:hypothetical protein